MINCVCSNGSGKYFGGVNCFNKELVSLEDAAEIMGVSKQYICKLCSDEKIDSIKLPARLVKLEDIQALAGE